MNRFSGDIKHTLWIVRTNREVQTGILTMFFIVFVFMGWIAVGFAHLNQYLGVLSLSSLLSPFTLIAVLLVRAEGWKLTEFRNDLSRLRDVIVGATVFSLSIVFIQWIAFQLILFAFRNVLIQIFATSFVPSNFVPNPLLLTVIGVCSISYFVLFGNLVITILPTMVLQGKFNLPAEKGDIARFAGFYSKPETIAVIVTYVISNVLVWEMFQVSYSLGMNNLTLNFIAAAWGLLAFLVNTMVSLYLRRIKGGNTVAQSPYCELQRKTT